MTQEQIKDEIKNRIINIIDNYTTNMQEMSDKYRYRDKFGVDKCDYAFIADDIIKEFFEAND
jgi:hypothetical protein